MQGLATIIPCKGDPVKVFITIIFKTNMKKFNKLCQEEYREPHTLIRCYEWVYQYDLSEEQFSPSYQYLKSTSPLT